MKFGIFYELQLPRPWVAGDELKLYQNALSQMELADKLNYDHAWVVEHHFLEEYSHSPSPESFLAAASQRTKNIRLGHGILQLTTGSLPAAYFLDDPAWFPGKSKGAWQEITSAGLGKPEPLKDGGLGLGNIWIAKDLIDAIEKDRQPLGSIYDGRAALEMILAVYESHRMKGPVEIPLKNRKHPLTLL